MTAPNGEPVSPLACFTLGHDWSMWAVSAAVDHYQRVCQRVGCMASELRHVSLGLPR